MCLLLHQKSHGGLVAVVVFFELPLSPLFDLAPTKLSFTDQIFIVNLFFCGLFIAFIRLCWAKGQPDSSSS